MSKVPKILLNAKTRAVYEVLGEVMLSKALSTAVQDGTRLLILKTKKGVVLARPLDEFKSGRLIEPKKDD